MSVPQDFVLSSITQAKRNGEMQWRAILRSAWIPDRHLELWFDEEGQARKIPTGAISTPSLLGLYLTPGQTITCSGTIRSPQFSKKNLYTGRWEKEPGWSVEFTPVDGQGPLQSMSLFYPQKAETTPWKIGQTYGLTQFANNLYTTGLFSLAITLANSEAEPLSAANVIGVLTQVGYGYDTVTPPTLTWDDDSATLTITGTLALTSVFNGSRVNAAANELAQTETGAVVTLLNMPCDGNLWGIVAPFGPSDMLGLLMPNISTYPEDTYVSQEEVTGFFDKYGYHPPATYPAETFTGGFVMTSGAFPSVAQQNLAAAQAGAAFISGVNATLNSVSAKGVNATTVNGNLHGTLVAGYNAGQVLFQAF